MTWVKGQSGNPKGKVRHSVREELRRQASKKRADGSTNVQAVARTAWTLAANGSLGAIQFVTEQLDGKLPQEVNGQQVTVFTLAFSGMQPEISGPDYLALEGSDANGDG